MVALLKEFYGRLTPAAAVRASYRRSGSPSGLASATTARGTPHPNSGKINTKPARGGATSSRAEANRSRRSQGAGVNREAVFAAHVGGKPSAPVGAAGAKGVQVTAAR